MPRINRKPTKETMRKTNLFVFILLTTFVVFFFSFKEGESKKVSSPKQYKAYYNTSYGKFAFDEILVKQKVQKDEFLSTIFQKNKLDYQHLSQLTAVPDSIFNEKRIRVGNQYGVSFILAENKLKPNKFIYEKNKVEYVVASFQDTFNIKLGEKPIETIEKTASGVISSSLYLTMQENKINPLLAIDLSEIYAWTIDFYHIQKGDYFKVIYTEKFVEGKSLNSFDIKASIFSHRGVEKEAFLYQGKDEHIGHYYDQVGDNMKQAFLKSPVKYSRISSSYNPRRFHPVQKRWKAHLGTDYAAPTGTPIRATADGVVSASTYKKYNGNYVKIKHNGMYSTQYLHMSKRAVKVGDFVEQGQVIGYVGSTGLATGPHVCYRFWKNGKQVDPYKQDLPKAKPIEAKYLEDFLEKIKPLQNKLEKIKTEDEYEI